MRRVKEILSTVWDFVWELVILIFCAAVTIIAAPLWIVLVIILSFYTKETPADVITDLAEAITDTLGIGK